MRGSQIVSSTWRTQASSRGRRQTLSRFSTRCCTCTPPPRGFSDWRTVQGTSRGSQRFWTPHLGKPCGPLLGSSVVSARGPSRDAQDKFWVFRRTKEQTSTYFTTSSIAATCVGNWSGKINAWFWGTPQHVLPSRNILKKHTACRIPNQLLLRLVWIRSPDIRDRGNQFLIPNEKADWPLYCTGLYYSK